MTAATVERSSNLGFYTHRYSYLPGPDGRFCRGEDEGGLASCIGERTRRRLEEGGGNFTCVPSHLKRVAPNMKVVAHVIHCL